MLRKVRFDTSTPDFGLGEEIDALREQVRRFASRSRRWPEPGEGRRVTPRRRDSQGRGMLHPLRPKGRRRWRSTHVRPFLQRSPKRWLSDEGFPADHEFDRQTERIGPPSWQRFGHPTVRFRSERSFASISDQPAPAVSGITSWKSAWPKTAAFRLN